MHSSALTPARFILIISILSLAYKAQNSCVQCAKKSVKNNRLCASDGKFYTDIWCAQCENNQNYEMFTCKQELAKNDCQSLCTEENRIYKCKLACEVLPVTDFTCNSAGRVYSNACREKCNTPDIVNVFNCYQYDFGIGNCSQKCSTLSLCKSQNSKAPKNSICGKDGLLYDSLDELKCNGEYLVYKDKT